MERLLLKTPPGSRKAVDHLFSGLNRRAAHGERGVCPVETAAVFLRLCQAQSCGKCVPCRIGLRRIVELLEKVLAGDGKPVDVALIEKTARNLLDSSDCAIGYEAAEVLLESIEIYRQDYDSHVTQGICAAKNHAVNCRRYCPADVDIPGYIALCKEGRYADALRLIRKDNPLPSACALICEHPCEEFCRRGIVDAPVNIRAIKRTIIEKSFDTPPDTHGPDTGKKVGVVGAGPAGLTAAYYLSRMGHSVTVYEKRRRTGGMLRYGIPVYRLPDKYLDADIDAILATGVELKTEIEVGKDITLNELREQYDSVLLTIGAHGGKSLGIAGEEGNGVLSAVKLLSDIGDGNPPDFNGKRVVVIGGGNVAMDATRTSIRLGAASVRCVYRRRVEDMTALPEEIEGAAAEGAEIIPLRAPEKIELDDNGNVVATHLKPQIIGEYKRGRPAPRNADLPAERMACDIVVVAIGQDIESEYFGGCGIPLKWDMLQTRPSCAIPGLPGVFAGGDCSSGPSTVIKAIEAGKVSAANIDAYLGFSHQIESGIDIPFIPYRQTPKCGRVMNTEREAGERKNDFGLVELPVTREETAQECARCLRCDHCGLGAFKGGRDVRW